MATGLRACWFPDLPGGRMGRPCPGPYGTAVLTAKQPPGLPTTEHATTYVRQMLLDVERQFRKLDSGAFFVPGRVVRRVLQHQLDIASPWLPPPHRKSCIVEQDRLLWLVARDELGVKADASLPRRLILIARPEADRLSRFSREDLLRYYWRLLFHARIDFALAERTAPERLPPAELQRRIAALGHGQFDEIQNVLRSEQMLRRPDDRRSVYAEFIAVYHELREFAPELLPLYFPSLEDETSVLQVIGADCDAAELLAATRPEGLAARPVVEPRPGASPVKPGLFEGTQTRLPARSPRKYAALARRADGLRADGNNVRAALVRRRAVDKAPLDTILEAQRQLMLEIEYLVLRLQAALEFTDDDVRPWLAMCVRLLPAARRGFWNANARLLYDLQQVCLDHEQELYRVDLLDWIVSRGRRPLKRPLPNLRVVLMSKHLRKAALRIPSVLVDDEGRRELDELLQAAADAAEQILRKQFEPLVADTLAAARFVPGSVVERVAFRKLTHELLDGVVDRGFLTLGDLRDAISRSQLKMPDLSSARELFSGDPLLCADRLLAESLDGVYQRGPFYLRWLQLASSLTFGLPPGRVATLYLALPFGLSFLGLMAVEEIAQMASRHMATVPVAAPVAAAGAVPVVERHVAAHHEFVYSHWNMFWLGCVLFALLHVPQFRAGLLWLWKKITRLLRFTFADVPRMVVAYPPVARLLQSVPLLLFYRFILAPLLVTALFWRLLPAAGVYPPLDRWRGLGIFFVSLLLLNSRVGRDTEELAGDFLVRAWRQIHVHLLMGLFTLVVDGIRRLMDGLERLLYAVDQWLRFRSGETGLTLAIKAVGGLAWTLIHGVLRFCVTLLIEPQINPIKHFPVVTVSHKLIFGTLTIPLATQLERFYDRPTAFTMTGLILSGTPGIFGFLAWELKENWKLYRANRPATLRPVSIGQHGETLLRLLVPGFHSGTIPRLFAKRRRAARQVGGGLHVDKQARFAGKLGHEGMALRHFFERELISLLHESRTFRERSLSVGRVDLATNRVSVTLCDARRPHDPVVVQFCERSGWIIAGVTNQGWLCDLTEEDRTVFRTALAGLYKLGLVGLVREQIESHLVAAPLPAHDRSTAGAPGNGRSTVGSSLHPYDISAEGLVVWPYGHYESTVRYPLDERPRSKPRPRSVARAAGLPPLALAALVFGEHSLGWGDWSAFWEIEQVPSAIPLPLLPGVELLQPP